MFRSIVTRAALVAVAFLTIVALPSTADAARRIKDFAPKISGTPPATVLAGSTYLFKPSASDPNKRDTLTFVISNKPLWAKFDTTNGTLSGAPASAYVGAYTGIAISVTDGRSTTSLPPFSITVTAPVVNRPPTISGSPIVEAQAGQPYSFRPAAADPDGDPLTFSVQNKPAWASFDTTTGTLYGTPTDASAGSYPNVVISACDGRDTSSLSGYTITVTLPTVRNALLRWTPPTRNVDGTTLADLTGYRVSYGPASRGYTTTLDVSGASMSSVVIEGLDPGTYYFAVKAVNAAGAVSDFSNEVSKVL